jgi:predicted dienelactone hydrolase
MKKSIHRAAGRVPARRLSRTTGAFGFATLAVAVAGLSSSALAGGCTGDFDGNGIVDGADLSLLLNGWGSSSSGLDIDGNGLVDGGDLAQVLNGWGACPPSTPPVETGIACQSTALFPFALFVNSFNFNETVRFAVDSQRFPDLAGRTVDIFLLDNRSAAAWATNPTLVDVRGTPQTFAVGTTLSGSIGTLTMTGIAAGSGDSPGRGLDLVVDADRNGILSSGDLIDGGGDGPGMWYVKDLSAAGPYAVTQVASYDVNDADIIDTMELERIYYPSTIASLSPRPLVVISHGNGHNYAWYDYLGNHLASWGYIVMSHQNDTVPGIETASTTTLEHTESFLAQLGTIAAGALNGKVDGDRIVWIGHSRGGEGIARGYDRLFDATFTSPNYQIADIRLLISIAPTDFLGTASANPHGVPFMLVYGSADGDVCGCPDSDIADSFNILERAEGWRQSTYVHGADHNDFNCCGFNDFAGPAGTAILNAEAQDVMKAASLAMIRRVVEGDRSAEEYLWRQYESLKPISVAATTTVINEWKPAPALLTAVDNFQTNAATTLGSAGGAVAFTGFAATLEAVQNDGDTSFTWLTSDQWNGATRGRTTDTTRGMILDWTAAASAAWTVPASLRDFRDDAAISLRAAQGTRHPNTISTLADLTFTVVLIDETGAESAILISAFGGGVEEPYQRTGSGTGTGWQNAYEAIRIPLDSFSATGRTIDMSRIASVVLRFGGTNGAASGRLHIDDLQIERE